MDRHCNFNFLGYTFKHKYWPESEAAPESVKRFRRRLREKLRTTRGLRACCEVVSFLARLGVVLPEERSEDDIRGPPSAVALHVAIYLLATVESSPHMRSRTDSSGHGLRTSVDQCRPCPYPLVEYWAEPNEPSSGNSKLYIARAGKPCLEVSRTEPSDALEPQCADPHALWYGRERRGAIRSPSPT